MSPAVPSLDAAAKQQKMARPFQLLFTFWTQRSSSSRSYRVPGAELLKMERIALYLLLDRDVRIQGKRVGWGRKMGTRERERKDRRCWRWHRRGVLSFIATMRLSVGGGVDNTGETCQTTVSSFPEGPALLEIHWRTLQ